jgi:hypothetical protein
MTCTNCGGRVPANVRSCPSCQTDVGFPNVRITKTPSEELALEKRLNEAYVSTEARSCKSVLEQFGNSVQVSKAVFCRSLNLIYELISSENLQYISFHKQIDAGSRLPKDDQWETGRPSVEAALFPHYHNEINFACLTLNDKGMSNYGGYSIVLRERMISLRASVFEENPFIFMQKHKIVTGQPIPPGFRAPWSARGRFAMAKLHSKLDKNTKTADFVEILLKSGLSGADDEFIEVHIYGPIHPSSFEKIVGPRPVKKSDLVLWKSLQTKCKTYGIIVEEC